ncbi:Hypothetical Protein FCC1311_068672 [Hondaea fermentalgiana]|uniref:Uncharacterized protein n=1 Tax=Hondaea fermentalgiana TaxID=2315210 RepID=A0A2R5GID0_9STRA|nr:Hypothetical Protein FCC1311_068672 [Hondaea fermentalgiana]|eukprot:GBG30647.1 Hypothetical Protein FCC1311_068672 [Hondaea fermentalgiana]
MSVPETKISGNRCDGDRTTIASIPASYLACGDDIVLTGADYPEIFVSGTDIVLQQCGLTDYCSAQNGFREVAAMEVMSEIFITTGSASEIDSLPAVCEVDSSDIVSSCPTQCCLLENDGAPICLNVSVATTPFCTDGSDGNAPDGTSCSDLIGSDAYVDISLELLEDQEDLNWVSTCCQTCAAWGDPKLVSFGGWSDSPAEWLMCDGRNPKKSCNFQQQMCTSQIDHLGNDCVWNDTIKDLMDGDRSMDLMDGDRSMVSFYGSPCQPDWAAAEAADWLPNVTFFTNEDFGVRVFTGERSVLTAMEFNISDTGYHRFDPSGCFDEDSSSAASAWSSYGDAGSSPEDDGFSTVCGDIDAGGLERSCAVTHTGSSAFMQFRCIRASHDDEYEGYRLNVQGISEFLPYSATGGFCVSDDLEEYMGESSENEAAASHCGLENDDLGTRLTMGQTCKNIYHPTCTADEAEEAIRKWCRYSAVLPLDDVLSCASDIIDGGSADGMASRWVSRFCAQFPGEVSKCKKDYTAYLDTTPTATMCFSSLDEMVDFGHDPCMVGVSVRDTASGEEILFIPDHIPPCDNVVRVPATSEYAAFFTSTVEFVKCGVSSSECPLYSALPSTFCDPVRSYSTVKSALAAIVAGVICAQKGAGQDPYECNESELPLCGDDTDTENVLLRAVASVDAPEDCDICNEFARTSLDPCCVPVAGITVTSECREIFAPLSRATTSNDYQTTDQVPTDANLVIPVNISYSVTAENACARTCRLYGDPEGLSFCNVRKEFILCDGRIDDADSPDVCTQTEETCLSRKDYYGNACVWLPDNTNNFTWTSGSPCQMDPTLPAPVQLVYSREPFNANNVGNLSYAVFATIGERGIITDVTFEFGGVNATINAVDCINSDGSTDGWTNPDAILPYLNVTTVLPGKQVIMDVLREDMGVHLICQAMEGHAARLDIDTLYITTPRSELSRGTPRPATITVAI